MTAIESKFVEVSDKALFPLTNKKQVMEWISRNEIPYHTITRRKFWVEVEEIEKIIEKHRFKSKKNIESEAAERIVTGHK